ncbi:MAG: TIR domain-containing protein [Elusimicrobiota bacterium]
MNIVDIIEKLKKCDFIFRCQKRLTNNKGQQLFFDPDLIVNVFDNGNISIQGKNANKVKDIIPRKANIVRKVFVVYGHDKRAKAELEAMLRRWQLEPLILDQLPSEGKTLIEKLEKYASDEVNFAVILATPDDVGYPCNNESQKKFRARQNVILELGLLLNKLGRSRLAIVIKNSDEMERPSDIEGLIYLPFNDSVEEIKTDLAKEMNKHNFSIDIAKL